MAPNTDTAALIRALVDKGYRVVDGQVLNPSGKPRKLGNKDGYPTLTMKVPKSRRVLPIPVHKIVAFVKYGESVFECEEIRHLNGNPQDFSESNIALGSRSDNALDRDADARTRHARNAFSHTIKYDTNVREEVIRLRATGRTFREIGAMLQMPESCTRAILNAKRFTGHGTA